MAGRGGPKLKEFRVPITSLKHWQHELAFSGLSIVEIYSSSFGSCQVVLPLINAIMMNTDKADQSIKWLTVNVGKIEEEARGALEEETKKAADMQSQINSKRMSIQSNMSPNNQIVEESKEADVATDDASNEEKTADADDQSTKPAANQSDKHLNKRKSTPVITLPGLEAYAGYDHPRPLWLFFVDGQMRYELTSCNPPKLSKLVAACLTGTQLSEAELSNMELASDSKEVSEEKKRKRKLAKMLQEQEAAKLKLQQDAEARKKKREITRDPEYLINLSINQFNEAVRTEILKLDEAAGVGRRVCVVLSCRETEADDYVYHSQTPALTVDQSTKSIVFPVSIVMKKLDNAELQANTELKWAIFDAADDEPIRGERAAAADNGCLGEVYVKAGAILNHEINQLHFMFTDHSLPPLSPSAAKSPRGQAKAELKIATLGVEVHERPSEGVCTDYRFQFQVDVDGLPGQPEPAPVKEHVEGEEADPSSNQAEPEATAENAPAASSWNFSMSILDGAAPVSVLQGTHNLPTLPTQFSFMATHYSRMERTIKFVVVNGDQIVGEAIVLFSALLTARASSSDPDHAVSIVLVNNQEPVANVKAVVRIEEIDGEGNVVPMEGADQLDEQTDEAQSESVNNEVDPDQLRVVLSVNDQGVVQLKIVLAASTTDQPDAQPAEIASLDTLSVSVKEAKSAKATPRQPMSPQHLSPKNLSPKLGAKGPTPAGSKPGSKQVTPRIASKSLSKATTPRVEYTSKPNSKAATPRLDPTPSKPGSKAVTPRTTALSVSKAATPREASNSLSTPGSKAATPRVADAVKPASKAATPRASVVEPSAEPAVELKPASQSVSPRSTDDTANVADELPVTPATEPAAAEDAVAALASQHVSAAVTPRVEQSESSADSDNKRASKPASKHVSQSSTPRVEQSEDVKAASKPASKPASHAATPRVEQATDVQSASKPASKPVSHAATPRLEQPGDVKAASQSASKSSSQAATPRVEQTDNVKPASNPESNPVSQNATPRVWDTAEISSSKPVSKAATPRVEQPTASASKTATPRADQSEDGAVLSRQASKSTTPRVEQTEEVASTSKPVSKPVSQSATPRVNSKPVSNVVTPRVAQTESSATESAVSEVPVSTEEESYDDDSQPLESEPAVVTAESDATDSYEDEFAAAPETVADADQAVSVSKPVSKTVTPRVEAGSKPASKAATPRIESTVSKPVATPRVIVAADVRDDGSVALSIEMQ